MSNYGSPIPKALPSAADLLRRLTGAASLAAGAMLYGVGTAQPATIALGSTGQVLMAGASAPVWSDTFTTAKTITASLTVTGARSYFNSGSDAYSIGMRYNSGTGIVWIGATNSATADLQISTGGGGTIALFKNNYDVVIPNGNLSVGASSGSKFSVVDNTAGALTYSDIQNSSLTGSGGAILRLITGNTSGTTTTSLGIVKYRSGPVYFSNNETNAAGVVIFQTASADVLTLGVDKSSTFAGVVRSSSGAIFGTDPGFTENVRFGSTIRFAGNLSIQGGVDFLFDATTGSKLGSSGAQKIGFWGATPVGQYSTTGTASGFTAGAGTAVKDDSTFTGNTGATAYRISDVIRALKLCGIMAA